MDIFSINSSVFGHSGFRDGQLFLISSILEGRDCLGIMPTGGGKSLCYQIPALALQGLTLVVSPLISLMNDQVAALRHSGVPADAINSSLSYSELKTAQANVKGGRCRLLYISPERLEAPAFLELVKDVRIPLIAVDEAHCISQWGQDFRPSYLGISDFVRKLPERPAVAAFTATATAEVRDDIIRLLRLDDPKVLVTGFDRPNLFFDVLRPKDKTKELISIIRTRAGRPGIVYCSTRSAVERVCAALLRAGISAVRYHAGLTDKERRSSQAAFQFDQADIIVATNAFGMGIDKSNVGFVIHYNMPKSLEAYYQEAGRAGRDGSPADCILLYSPGDLVTAKHLIEHDEENDSLSPEERAELRRMELFRLRQMNDYCAAKTCYRGFILDYFGQEHEPGCGNCGNCLAVCDSVDITTEAQMVLSCVKRIRGALGYNVGSKLLVQVLTGSRSQRVLDLGLDRLSTYGLLHSLNGAQVKEYIELLLERGYLSRSVEHGALSATDKAAGVLFRGERVTVGLRRRPAPKPARRKRGSGEDAKAAEPQSEAQELFNELRSVRTRLAREQGIPPFMVFSDAVLWDMVRLRPQTAKDFLCVSGVGEYKAKKYGAVFLEALREHGQSGSE